MKQPSLPARLPPLPYPKPARTRTASLIERLTVGWELFCLEQGLQTDGQLLEDHILEGSYGHLVVGRAVVLSANVFGMEHLMVKLELVGRASWRRPCILAADPLLEQAVCMFGAGVGLVAVLGSAAYSCGSSKPAGLTQGYTGLVFGGVQDYNIQKESTLQSVILELAGGGAGEQPSAPGAREQPTALGAGVPLGVAGVAGVALGVAGVALELPECPLVLPDLPLVLPELPELPMELPECPLVLPMELPTELPGLPL